MGIGRIGRPRRHVMRFRHCGNGLRLLHHVLVREQRKWPRFTRTMTGRTVLENMGAISLLTSGALTTSRSTATATTESFAWIQRGIGSFNTESTRLRILKILWKS
jgi:hypothetical protein